MNLRNYVRKWLIAPPLTGRSALLCAIILLAVPTLLRAAVGSTVSEAGFVTYTPFVLLSALLLRWPHAVLVAAAAAMLGDYMFVGPPHRLMDTADDLFGGTVFLLSSALIIGLGHAMKCIVSDRLWLYGAEDLPNGVVFSLREGQAHVSWYGERSFVHLGPEEEVAELMKDFLAQCELGRRLAKRTPE